MEAEDLDTQYTARKSLGMPVVGEPQFKNVQLENIDTLLEFPRCKSFNLPSALEFMCLCVCVCVCMHMHTHASILNKRYLAPVHHDQSVYLLSRVLLHSKLGM